MSTNDYTPGEMFDLSMARLRALLTSRGTMDDWRELRIILRQETSPEHQAMLLNYVDGHILDWAPALFVSLLEWWRQNPQQPDYILELLQKMLDWQWSPGRPGERRGVPGLPDAYIVWVPAGAFRMGNDTEDADPAEQPCTIAAINRGFWMWQTPVTQGQYRTLMGHNPAYFSGPEAHPVERVTWHEALAFCHALSERLELSSCVALRGDRLHCRAAIAGPYHVNKRYLGSDGFRLPSEAEWEWACRTTTEATLPLRERAWYADNAKGHTQGVGQKEPNAWGLHDMLGNVAEWCVDQWHNALPGGQEIDPLRLGPKMPQEGTFRALRGSSWYHQSDQLRPSYRDKSRAEESLAFFGFRPVKAG